MAFKLLLRGLVSALILGASITLTGCGPDADDDYLCTVPTTNNPNFIEDSGRSMIRMPNQY